MNPIPNPKRITNGITDIATPVGEISSNVFVNVTVLLAPAVSTAVELISTAVAPVFSL